MTEPLRAALLAVLERLPEVKQNEIAGRLWWEVNNESAEVQFTDEPEPTQRADWP